MAEDYNPSDPRGNVRYYRQMRADLAAKRITPRSVIGTGYVGNTRQMANLWIDQQIDREEGRVATEYGASRSKYPGYRTMTASQRYNARMAHVYESAVAARDQQEARCSDCAAHRTHSVHEYEGQGASRTKDRTANREARRRGSR